MSSGSDRSVLVTGGAGFIGSHTAKALSASGLTPVVFDNLSSGYRDAVRWGPFVHGDIRDLRALLDVFHAYPISAVIHFAGLIEVGRSVQRPDIFWDVNVNGTANVLTAMRMRGIDRLVFSSSAAVYGEGGRRPLDLISEDALKDPSSPYGDTKLAGERMIEAQCRAYGLSAVALRYFNAAGADPSAEIGEAHEPETHLIPLAIASTLGEGPPLTLFGDDFETPDGTCLRDYIHVADLASAHVAAVQATLPAGAFEALNVGTGRGASVREVISAVGRTLGRTTPVTLGPRRAGDPASLVADPSRARAVLGWEARCSSLDQIVSDAARWEMNPAFGAGRRASRPPHRAQFAA